MCDDEAGYDFQVESSDLSGFSSSQDDESYLSDDEIIFNKKASSDYAKMTRDEKARVLAQKYKEIKTEICQIEIKSLWDTYKTRPITRSKPSF